MYVVRRLQALILCPTRELAIQVSEEFRKLLKYKDNIRVLPIYGGHSSEMAFKMATILAFKKGFMDASPVLLEPIVSMKVTVPDKFTGDVMGDLNKRRGRVLGMTPDHQGNTIIEADVPQLEIYGYSTDLRSMTGGSGEFSYEFARYEQAPNDIQAKEIEARASKVDKSEE